MEEGKEAERERGRVAGRYKIMTVGSINSARNLKRKVTRNERSAERNYRPHKPPCRLETNHGSGRLGIRS